MGHVSEDTFTGRLQDILRVANDLKELTAFASSSNPSFRNGHSLVAMDSISLPWPPALLPSLLEAGACHGIAVSASKIYQLRAEELRKSIQAYIVTASHKIAEFPAVASALSPDLLIKKVVSTAAEVYCQRLEQWKEEIVQRVKQVSNSPANNRVAPKNTRAFNHEYIPLLEHFFEENPFPTHADKIFLAKKSNMEYRQIHVWFQNRRNRTKKEGKTLRKKPAYEAATKSWDKPYQRMNGHMVDSDSRVPKFDKGASLKGITEVDSLVYLTNAVANGNQNVSKDALFSCSPLHAFPSPYPPACHYDPFPCKSGPVRFSKPEWRRVPDGKHPSSLLISFDDLIKKFYHLSVRDGTRPQGSSKHSHAATDAITVVPSRAPHPSLMDRKYSQPANMAQLRPLVRAPVTYSKAFQSPSPTSKPVTLVPFLASPNKSELLGKRNIASLPRRFPGRMRNTRRDTTPSESFSTSSSSPPLSSTDSESDSCSSSVSSLYTYPTH